MTRTPVLSAAAWLVRLGERVFRWLALLSIAVVLSEALAQTRGF